MGLTFTCRHRYSGGFDLDLELAADAPITAICGPSGSGKSTILMLIAGLLRPDHGRIVVGADVFVDTEQKVWLPPHKRDVGLVTQDSLLFPHQTVRKNLEYGLTRRPAMAVDFSEVVNCLELQELLDRYPATLSGGQARRVAIGRALLRGPRLLLLDEPWIGLDEPLRESVAQYMQRCLAIWQIPTLLVSHDRAFVQTFADDILEIAAGRLV